MADLRSFIEKVRQESPEDVLIVSKEVDPRFEITALVAKLEQGADKVTAATFAYTSTAFPMLTGTLVTIAGFVPVGFAASSAGEYCFTLFAVVGTALTASWFVAVMCGPAARTIRVPLSFLGAGRFQATLVRDDAADGSTVKIEHRKRIGRSR